MYVDKGGEYVDVDIMSSFLTHFLSVVVFPSNMISVDEQLKYECVMLKLQFNQIEISVIAHVFPWRQMNKCGNLILIRMVQCVHYTINVVYDPSLVHHNKR